MHKLLVFVLLAQLVSVSGADEWSTCQESGKDKFLPYDQCLEFLEKRLIERYPTIAERSDRSLTLIASNPNSNVTVGEPNRENESYYLVAHFPKFALSIVAQHGFEFFTRHVFNHRSGQFLEVSGWPAFSDDGTTIAFFSGPFMGDNSGILAIYSRDFTRITRDYYGDYIAPMAIFHTQWSWFTAVTFQSNNDFIATMACLEYVDVDDVGKQWIVTGQTEEVSFQYNGGMWRPSILKQCAIKF